MKEQPQILLVGMPDAAETPWDMNFAQAPQGPIIKESLPVSDDIRSRIDHVFRYLFNPRDRMSYPGMHLIAQNLEKDVPSSKVDVVDYPDERKILEMIEAIWYDVVGISIGAEPYIKKAALFAKKIRGRSKNKNVKIVLGNYGAASGRCAGVLDDDDGDYEVLWHSPKEREDRRAKEEIFYTGEGVRDMRLFLREHDISVNADPDDPLVSKVVAQKTPDFKNPILKKLAEKFGFAMPLRRNGMLSAGLGCPNRCYFCNTSKMFGKKVDVLKNAEEIFMEICRYMDSDEGIEDNSIPGISVTLMDDNLTKNMNKLIELCGMVKESKRDIRLSIFGDIAGLHEYLKKHGSFIEFLRGGLSAVWMGIESRDDFFHKRAGATPEDVERIVQEFQKIGIVVIGSFIVGLPMHTEGQDDMDADGKAREANIHRDFRWGRGLKTGGYQVMLETPTNLTSPDLAEEIGRHSAEEWGHVRTNPKNIHPHIGSERLGELDKKFRRREYLENGPASVRSLLIMWDGYKNLRGSNDPSDLKMANYFYWMCRVSADVITFASAFSNLPVFERHSDGYLERLRNFFKEVDSLQPPACELSRDYEKVFTEFDQKKNPFVRFSALKIRGR